MMHHSVNWSFYIGIVCTCSKENGAHKWIQLDDLFFVPCCKSSLKSSNPLCSCSSIISISDNKIILPVAWSLWTVVVILKAKGLIVSLSEGQWLGWLCQHSGLWIAELFARTVLEWFVLLVMTKAIKILHLYTPLCNNSPLADLPFLTLSLWKAHG